MGLIIEKNKLVKCESLESSHVVIPYNVKTIGYSAFSEFVLPSNREKNLNRVRLKTISLHNGVSGIGEYAFSHCEELTEIDIPEKVLCLKRDTFFRCTSLKKVTLPKGLKRIEGSVFLSCFSLKEVVLPDNLIELGSSAFERTAIEEIVLPDRIIEIKDSTFFGCHSLKKISFPKFLTRILRCAFCDCKSIKEIVLPDRVMYIGPGAFSGCDSLERVVVPSGVNKIASTTFACCRKLTHAELCVELPDTVVEIANDAFIHSENVVIKAPCGSYAIQYAKENSIKYEII